MIPGRYHWTQTITVLEYKDAKPDPSNPFGQPLTPAGWAPVEGRANIPAYVESLDRETQIKLDLNVEVEHWFIRTEPGSVLTPQDNRIRWHATTGNIDLTIVTANAIPGDEIELTCTKAQ